MERQLTDDSYRKLHKSMVDFGYKVDLAFVTDETDHILDGNKPRNVVGMFLENRLKKAGLLATGRSAGDGRETPSQGRGR